MNYIIANTEQDAQAIENILYHELMTEDGINFKPPFRSGACYLSINDYVNIDGQRRALPITDEMIELAQINQTIANLINNYYTNEQLNKDGWSIQN